MTPSTLLPLGNRLGDRHQVSIRQAHTGPHMYTDPAYTSNDGGRPPITAKMIRLLLSLTTGSNYWCAILLVKLGTDLENGRHQIKPLERIWGICIYAARLGRSVIFGKDAKPCTICVHTVPCTKALNKYLLPAWLQITKHHYSNGVVLSATTVHSFLGQGLQYVHNGLGWDTSESAVGEWDTAILRLEASKPPSLGFALQPQQKQQSLSLVMFNHRVRGYRRRAVQVGSSQGWGRQWVAT